MTRKAGDQIRINNGELFIEVIEVSNREVRLAFRASKEILIERVDEFKTKACKSESK